MESCQWKGLHRDKDSQLRNCFLKNELVVADSCYEEEKELQEEFEKEVFQIKVKRNFEYLA